MNNDKTLISGFSMMLKIMSGVQVTNVANSARTGPQFRFGPSGVLAKTLRHLAQALEWSNFGSVQRVLVN